jgi:transcription initiation factor TFIIF subunit alpha
MRLQSKRVVNPMNPDEFTMPIRLHRRDPKAPLQGVKEQNAANAQAAADKAAAEAAEDPKLAEERAKKDAERAAILEKIAPHGGAQKQKKQAFKKKTQQVFKQNEADKKLRYEEYFPWFIEDFDNKNTWQGQLENPLSGGTFAMFVLDDGAFKMVPIEKWYKFTEKNKFKTLSIEEAENAIKKNSRQPRWLMKMTKAEEKERERQEKEGNMRALNKLATRRGDRLERILPKSETADADDLDFDDDRFADDEEAPIVEGEETENKEIEVNHPNPVAVSRSRADSIARNASKRNKCRRISSTLAMSANTRRRSRNASALRRCAINTERKSDGL